MPLNPHQVKSPPRRRTLPTWRRLSRIQVTPRRLGAAFHPNLPGAVIGRPATSGYFCGGRQPFGQGFGTKMSSSPVGLPVACGYASVTKPVPSHSGHGFFSTGCSLVLGHRVRTQLGICRRIRGSFLTTNEIPRGIGSDAHRRPLKSVLGNQPTCRDLRGTDRLAQVLPKTWRRPARGGRQHRFLLGSRIGTCFVRLVASGEIVPGLQALDAVQTGTVELCHTAAYYYIGKDPTFTLPCALPFGPNARQQNAWFYHAGGNELVNEFVKKFNLYAAAVTPARRWAAGSARRSTPSMISRD